MQENPHSSLRNCIQGGYQKINRLALWWAKVSKYAFLPQHAFRVNSFCVQNAWSGHLVRCCLVMVKCVISISASLSDFERAAL